MPEIACDEDRTFPCFKCGRKVRCISIAAVSACKAYADYAEKYGEPELDLSAFPCKKCERNEGCTQFKTCYEFRRWYLAKMDDLREHPRAAPEFSQLTPYQQHLIWMMDHCSFRKEEGER